MSLNAHWLLGALGVNIEETMDDTGPLIESFVSCDCGLKATLSLLISGFAE